MRNIAKLYVVIVQSIWRRELNIYFRNFVQFNILLRFGAVNDMLLFFVLGVVSELLYDKAETNASGGQSDGAKATVLLSFTCGVSKMAVSQKLLQHMY